MTERLYATGGLLQFVELRMRSPLDIRANVLVQAWDAGTPALEAAARARCLGQPSAVQPRLLWERAGHNRVTTAGRNLTRDLLNPAVGGAALSHFALGTGQTAPADGDAALETEVYRDDLTQIVPGTGAFTAKYFLPSTALNGQTLYEAGLFNDPDAGSLFARYTEDPIVVKDNTIAMTFSWLVSFTAV
jgi:hypothetical protein